MSTDLVLAARTIAEACQYVDLAFCDCGASGLPESATPEPTAGGGQVGIAFCCPSCGRERSYRFTVADPSSGAEFGFGADRSTLIDAGQWVFAGYEWDSLVTEALAELDAEPDAELVCRLLRTEIRAAAAVEQALRFLPETAQRIGADAVFTDQGRYTLANMASLCTAESLHAARTRFYRRIAELVRRCRLAEATVAELESLVGERLPFGTRPGDVPERARTRAEAAAFTFTVPCRCGTHERLVDAVQDGGDAAVLALFGDCASCGRPRECRFVGVDDDTAAPPSIDAFRVSEATSRLFDAAGFVWLARRYSEIADLLPRPADDDWYRASYHLRYAALAWDEAASLCPAEADAVPAETLWTETGTAEYRRDPAMLTRQRLAAGRADAWRRYEDFLASHPRPTEQDDWPLAARSAAERLLYLRLHPCSCGATAMTPELPTVLLVDDVEILRYDGSCSGCGTHRRIDFATPATAEDPILWALESSPSEIVDAGQWLTVADDLAESALGVEPLWRGAAPTLDGLASATGADLAAEIPRLYARAAAAIEEVLKFLPPGSDAVPASAFWTDDGRACHDRAALRFHRAALVEERERHRAKATEHAHDATR